MARGGGNNGGRGSSDSGGSGINNNRFANLETNDRTPGEDSSSPYFLSNNENPGLFLVSTHLIGSNFNSWNRAMSMALVAKNKLCFVDGSIDKLTVDDLVYGSWSRCNSMVMSWILHSVSKDIAESIMYLDSAVDMLSDLYDRFHQGNTPRVFQIKQLLGNLVQGSSDVIGYFTRLRTLWEELKDFRPFPVCSCGAMKQLIDLQQQGYVLQFLMGLNESFSQVRAQILMLDPLPSINKVFSLIVQEERQRSLSSLNFSQPSVVAYGASSSNYNSYKGKKDKPYCTHCGILGHTIEKCYKIHGYPPGYKPKGKFSDSVKGQHDKSGYSKPIVNQTGLSSEIFEQTEQSLVHDRSTLTSSQCQQLISFLSS
ncbi:hypothetical protein UlMin_046008 [Ulmus minor]